MRRVILTMIVKDEAAVIERCLTSFRGWIDRWCIVDTGSSDDTAARIEAFFAQHQIPGRLHKRPWVDFEHNRNEALELARDYVRKESNGRDPAVTVPETQWHALVTDADEQLCAEDGHTAESLLPLDRELTADAYLVPILHGCRYERIRLFRLSDYDWWYPVHEVTCRRAGLPAATMDRLTNCHVQSYTDGARAKDASRWVRDAVALDAAITVREKGEKWRGRELDLARLYFYAGNSYFYAGLYAEALLRYEKRLTFTHYPEEVFQAYYMTAKCRHAQKRPKMEVVSAYLAAYAYRPTRVEPLYHLVQYLINEGDYAFARLYAPRLLTAVPPPDVLFVEERLYEAGAQLAKLLQSATPADAIALARIQCERKQWAEILTTLGMLPPEQRTTLSPVEMAQWHDLAYVAYTWLQQPVAAQQALNVLWAIPIEHWRPRAEYLVKYLTEKGLAVPENVRAAVAGEQVAGEQVAGEQVAGEQVAGEQVAGEQVAGEQVAA